MSTPSCGACRHWQTLEQRYNYEQSGLCKLVPRPPFWLLIHESITLAPEGAYCEAFEEKPC